MLKTTSAIDQATSVELEDENPEQGSKRIQVENWDETELAKKSHKMVKGQKTAKFQKWIWVEKREASWAKNLGIG